jgi:hypothetical protein
MGGNPFFSVGRLGSVVPAYNPPHFDSQQVYAHIAQNLDGWIEHAIQLRAIYP